MRNRTGFLVASLVTGMIFALQPACNDDSGGGDDTETAGTDSTADTGSDVTSSDADTGSETAADTSAAEGNGTCTCMTQAECAAGVNEVDYTFMCTATGAVCCEKQASTGDTSQTNDTSSETTADTTTNWWDSDSQTSADTATNWWDSDTETAADTGSSGWEDTETAVDTADTSGDTANDGDCPHTCMTRQECWQQDGERMRDYECTGDLVCCDLGDTSDTGDDTEADTADDTGTESPVECQYDCVNPWQCDADDEYEVEDQECDGNDICCATVGDEDTETETAQEESECASEGLLCVAESQCSYAQARDEYECDVNGTVCCDLN